MPATVFGFGGLKFYRRENAEERGDYRPYPRANGSEAARDDPYALHLDDTERLRGPCLAAAPEDTYYRDQNVSGDGISIEDAMAVPVPEEVGGHAGSDVRLLVDLFSRERPAARWAAPPAIATASTRTGSSNSTGWSPCSTSGWSSATGGCSCRRVPAWD